MVQTLLNGFNFVIVASLLNIMAMTTHAAYYTIGTSLQLAQVTENIKDFVIMKEE